jgi:metal-responsive CopG/Arc/MetJ family transcriptional regulator
MVDRLAGESRNRSEFIELALRDYIARRARNEQNAQDLTIINRRHKRLNEEAKDVLLFQGEW